MKKILVAEDDRFLANAYKLKLGKAGYEVKVAEDGEEVLAILKDFTPDLIILDLVMPKLDGFAALAEIKKSERLKDTPVIVASNLGQEEDVERARKEGAVDYILKADMSMATLIQKIKSLLPETA